HTSRNVAGTRAEIDERFSFTLGIPFAYRPHPNFQLECSGDAIHSLVAISLRALRVLVQVDESGRDNQAASINFYLASESVRRDRCDFLAVDSYLANCVEAGLRIHDTTAAQDNIV